MKFLVCGFRPKTDVIIPCPKVYPSQKCRAKFIHNFLNRPNPNTDKLQRQMLKTYSMEISIRHLLCLRNKHINN